MSGWARQLSRRWWAEDAESAGTLYVHGHRQPYYGSVTHLAQALCAAATALFACDHRLMGQPHGRAAVFRSAPAGGCWSAEGVGRTDGAAVGAGSGPYQPRPEPLAADATLDRLVLVFDGEGYSPEVLKRMKERPMGCLSYPKYPGGGLAEGGI